MASQIRTPAKRGGDWAAPDPVGELRFRVKIPGVEIGRFTEVSGLQIEYEVVEYAEGGNSQFTYKLRGARKYPNLVLKRGVTNEDALMAWFLRYDHMDRGPI